VPAILGLKLSKATSRFIETLIIENESHSNPIHGRTQIGV